MAKRKLVENIDENKTELKIPYETAEDRGKYLNLIIPKKDLVQAFVPDEGKVIEDIAAETTKAVNNPVSGSPLEKILKGAKKVTVITENQFRQAPVPEVLSVLLKYVKAAGATPSIIIGCGKIPTLTPEEIATKLGSSVAEENIKVYCNDVTHPENYVYKGITSAGIAVWVHKVVAEADVVLTISSTQATLWGYGGSGMVIPAVSNDDTIEYNHIMSLAPDCVPGNNKCSMQKDKYEAAKIVGLTMGINIIVDNQFNVTYINAGSFEAAHKKAIKVYDKMYRFNAYKFKEKKADIVIAGSSGPTDHLFFHTGWIGMNCWPIVKEGGTIIFTSPCPGYGSWTGFALMDALTPYMPVSKENFEKVLKSFYDKKNGLWAGCIWYKIYAAMMHADLYIVTRKENIKEARNIGLTVFETVDKAYSAAVKKSGKNPRVAFVPYGRYSIFDV